MATQPPGDHLVRLSVNVSPAVSADLQAIARKKGLSATEVVRRALTLMKFVEDELDAGNTLETVGPDGEHRKIVLFSTPPELAPHARPPRIDHLSQHQKQATRYRREIR